VAVAFVKTAAAPAGEPITEDHAGVVISLVNGVPAPALDEQLSA
jgi:hypothetical protein